ncbi:unknown [Sinorhizobium phage PBC5]|nr:unknown [Sinorhizobium phage PBC5]
MASCAARSSSSDRIGCIQPSLAFELEIVVKLHQNGEVTFLRRHVVLRALVSVLPDPPDFGPRHLVQALDRCRRINNDVPGAFEVGRDLALLVLEGEIIDRGAGKIAVVHCAPPVDQRSFSSSAICASSSSRRWDRAASLNHLGGDLKQAASSEGPYTCMRMEKCCTDGCDRRCSQFSTLAAGIPVSASTWCIVERGKRSLSHEMRPATSNIVAALFPQICGVLPADVRACIVLS